MQLKLKKPMVVVLPDGMRRLAAFAFTHPKGLCFVDLWWDTPEAHPFHVLEGPVRTMTGANGFVVGDSYIYELQGDDPRYEWDEWERWQSYLGDGGAYLTEKMAIEAARKDGAEVE
jgi:hypothetical protein